MPIQSINPKNGTPIKEYPELHINEINALLDKSWQAFEGWKRLQLKDRTECFRSLAMILRTNALEYGELMANEMGKPIDQGIQEVEKCAWCCEYYVQNAPLMLKDEFVSTEAQSSFITYQPLGVIFAIMPWNFPFWQVFRAAVPALMAGNAMVLKHSSLVPGCALKIERIFQEAGFPEGLFRSLLIENDKASAVLSNKNVRAVTFTGSTEAGAIVASNAGMQLKKIVLELGGSDPYLILEDADIAKAARLCAKARMLNSGQSCIAAKRFIVINSVKKNFENFFVEEMRAYTPGNPLEEGTQLGPLASTKLRDQLHKQVQGSIHKGAKLLLGGTLPEGNGAYYPATILTDVTKGMPAFDEELFGPVAAVISAKDEAQAIRMANDTSFGLGAAVFTKDIERGRRIARDELEAGSCFVNDFVKSDPRLPFGGIKRSGYGRELSSFGIHEFVNIKTVVVK
ncbi:MAG: succinate-semialdehyde dehydrogenase [Verrucomicrobia bacterium CG_4_10_14_3_um_filter_43_23]|nr:MAG: succinate-semialdehyde dehydrogenase [Verrucomicrobia bacterium CG1_02_43_26]PIP59456.1 MAG: succinate-semialdehyde dehydrogenase [Verrucomicrobia bacterium CG22_combo_CG10-13_8_21_14_all_43_17]PIX58617.1 MAG: succinate-semialdehyde dehydrogenase [Verrucomicrobia bacterium CG_4_10_14_3_um_filter_43_23]PIY61442.1 MAG: succinate-semialdehyde dehydrogenase [Verrucomicrobia bacterium CG_4_10_14_0_8_um_filter_43_34]PJA43810.1 MAG: succinate-semialdehyde dehydrogenase [Verrucomicrobia bacteri